MMTRREDEIERAVEDADPPTDDHARQQVIEQRAVRELLSGLPSPALPAGFEDSIMRRLERPPRQRTPLGEMLLRALELRLRVRPALLALAVALLAGVLAGRWLFPAVSPGQAPSVTLVLVAPAAQTVAVAGDFNRWQPEVGALRDDDGDGVWTTTLQLSPGRYEYMFVIDGERWVTDPLAHTYRPDGFGNQNAVLEL